MSEPQISMRARLKKALYASGWNAMRPLAWLGGRLYFAGKQLEYLKDWDGPPNPEWFNHEFDLAFFWKWRLPYFFERGIYASEIVRGKDVLDLCCGDGSVSALFVSPLARSVVAVDFDPKAIRFARRRFGHHSNLKFETQDIRDLRLPKEAFDVCLWEAAIEHFTQAEMDSIIGSIKSIVRKGGTLHGHTIKRAEHESHHDHEYEFETLDELREFLHRYFDDVQVWERPYRERTNFYFRCGV